MRMRISRSRVPYGTSALSFDMSMDDTLPYDRSKDKARVTNRLAAALVSERGEDGGEAPCRSEVAQRLKDNGTALKMGSQVMVTKVLVKRNSHIEFQLGGGGYGTFGDWATNGANVSTVSAGDGSAIAGSTTGDSATSGSVAAASGPSAAASAPSARSGENR